MAKAGVALFGTLFAASASPCASSYALPRPPPPRLWPRTTSQRMGLLRTTPPRCGERRPRQQQQAPQSPWLPHLRQTCGLLRGDGGGGGAWRARRRRPRSRRRHPTQALSATARRPSAARNASSAGGGVQSCESDTQRRESCVVPSCPNRRPHRRGGAAEAPPPPPGRQKTWSAHSAARAGHAKSERTRAAARCARAPVGNGSSVRRWLSGGQSR